MIRMGSFMPKTCRTAPLEHYHILFTSFWRPPQNFVNCFL
jgi:hypothetical protein